MSRTSNKLGMHILRCYLTRLMARRQLWLVLGCLVWVAHSAPNFDLLQQSFVERWGPGGLPRFNAWRELVVSGAGRTDLERLKRVNEFFNRSTTFGDDVPIWGASDYWATPLETVGKGSGDCEDFVIAKYYTLQLVGVPADKLRLTYVHARTGVSTTTTAAQAHMVLVYYPQPDDEPLVLDNLVSDVRLASRRPDLSPVFSFNSQGIFAGTSGKEIAPAVGAGRLSRWEDLLKRVRAEGFQ